MLSLVMITKNCEDVIQEALESARGFADEVVIVDDYSKDRTIDIAKKYGAKVFFNRQKDFGTQKAYGVKKAKGEWTLILDSDERLTHAVKREIISLLSSKTNYDGFMVPYQNHFLEKPLRYGGEDYKKLVLFKKKSSKIESALVHEKFILSDSKVGVLKNKILHFSYRSVVQMYKKFTDYGIRSAKQRISKGEKTSLKKVFLYPIHMFWARFIKDKGYKDGFFRIPLDVGFAYLEFLTYFLMLFIKNEKKN